MATTQPQYLVSTLSPSDLQQYIAQRASKLYALLETQSEVYKQLAPTQRPKLQHLFDTNTVYEYTPSIPRQQQPEHEVSQLVDHTLLAANATAAQIKALCAEATQHNFYSVCVNGSRVKLVKELLLHSPVKVAAVCGFPLGSVSTAVKLEEARSLVVDGADEIDMVINVGWLKDQDYVAVYHDIASVVREVPGRLVKVIIETSLLTQDEIIDASVLSVLAAAHFVKTSTGFSTGGATIENVKLMRTVVGPSSGVKASGGCRTYDAAQAMIQAGATRLGTSSGVAIVQGAKQSLSSGGQATAGVQQTITQHPVASTAY